MRQIVQKSNVLPEARQPVDVCLLRRFTILAVELTLKQGRSRSLFFTPSGSLLSYIRLDSNLALVVVGFHHFLGGEYYESAAVIKA